MERGGETGQVPGLRYARVIGGEGGGFGFAATAGYSFDNMGGFFTYTLDKACAYSCDTIDPDGTADPTRPTECGELNFDMLISADADAIAGLAMRHEAPPQVLLNWSHGAQAPVLPPAGSLLEIGDPQVECHQAVLLDDGRLKLALQRRGGAGGDCLVKAFGRSQKVVLPPWKITEIVL
jgi:hypothetical protein